MDWQPIETAPKDMHTKAQLWRDGWLGPVLGELLYDNWCMLSHEGDLVHAYDEIVHLDPTHWREIERPDLGVKTGTAETDAA